MSLLDQFYTKPEVAEECVEHLSKVFKLEGMRIIEPSAGSGSFLTPLIKRGLTVKGMDVVPRSPLIEKKDFLTTETKAGKKPILFIGNPPFGRMSNTAVLFFNKAAESADLIAFIVPRTFRKISIQDRLNRNFWLVHDSDLPRRSFVKDDRPHNVPCAWQIWKREKKERPEAPNPDVSHIIKFVKEKRADFAIRRVGYHAGRVLPLDNGEHYSPSSTLFVRAVRNDAIDMLSSIDWSELRTFTAGVRSVSKREIAIKLAELT